MKPSPILSLFLCLVLFFTQDASADPILGIDSPIELELNGGPQAFAIMIENAGQDEALAVSAARFDAGTNFKISTLPDPIAPGEVGALGITFSPNGGNGRFTDTLSIESNDPAMPVSSVTVAGSIHDPRIEASSPLNVGEGGAARPSLSPILGRHGSCESPRSA
jgi:hypothetical protein